MRADSTAHLSVANSTMNPTSNSVANATENVETSCVVLFNIFVGFNIKMLKPITFNQRNIVMKILHVCEVCGADVGTIVCPKCLKEAFQRQSEEEELNEIERVFGSYTDCSDPALDNSLFGP